jgi:hypothetical protein
MANHEKDISSEKESMFIARCFIELSAANLYSGAL